MRRKWWERVLESIADRGRELLDGRPNRMRIDTLEDLCVALLSERGEASGTAIARDVIQRYAGMGAGDRAEFLEMLQRRFGADPREIDRAAARYRDARDLESFLALTAAVEPPRQELFRRLNMAPRATVALVDMRARLLDLLPERPHLRAVDADLKHLLSSWFNRGFLQLERIDWHTSAVVLEKLINYETVHEIKDWDDLHRRLERDRRCFAFMHPALPDEPLIFVEVALVRGTPSEVQPLLDPKAPVATPETADTAVFYSINNTLQGLRGVSFGNFLIKQVVAELSAEFPRLKTFVTLSPLPLFARTLRAAVNASGETTANRRYESLLAAAARELKQEEVPTDLGKLIEIAQGTTALQRAALGPALRALALGYLTLSHSGNDGVIDPVARFHLSNGARLERINVYADNSDRGMRNAFGVMVNYLYDLESVEDNHEKFVANGEIAMSRSLARDLKVLREAWASADPVPESRTAATP
jgi:malonyl-CoA decarboxylase